MKTSFRLWLLALGFFALGSVVGEEQDHGVVNADAPNPAEPAAPGKMHAVIAQLLKHDAGVASPSEPTAAPPPKVDDKEVLLLAAVSVTAKQVPNLELPKETPLENFPRTGVIAEHVGPEVTTKLWFWGGHGLMLSFNW